VICQPRFCEVRLRLTGILLHTQSRMSRAIRTLSDRMKVHSCARTSSGARIQVHARACIRTRARPRHGGSNLRVAVESHSRSVTTFIHVSNSLILLSLSNDTTLLFQCQINRFTK